MVARFFREFQSKHPTMWNLQRTETLASIQRQDVNKKRKLSEHVEIAVLGTEPDTLTSFHRLR
eukprot:4074188-Karenia_brevis.AAC.1